MFKLVAIIILFFFFILLFGIFVIIKVVRTFLGFGNKYNPAGSNSKSQSSSYSGGNNRSAASSSKVTSDKKKVFGDDEGEYVEFEEIKD